MYFKALDRLYQLQFLLAMDIFLSILFAGWSPDKFIGMLPAFPVVTYTFTRWDFPRLYLVQNLNKAAVTRAIISLVACIIGGAIGFWVV